MFAERRLLRERNLASPGEASPKRLSLDDATSGVKHERALGLLDNSVETTPEERVAEVATTLGQLRMLWGGGEWPDRP